MKTKVVPFALSLLTLVAACFISVNHSQAQSNLNLRVMAANITSGNNQRYESPGLNIFKGLKPDIVALQEFNVSNGFGINTTDALSNMVATTFGTDFNYFRETGYNIPNGIISRYPIIAAGSWDDNDAPDRGFAWAQIDLPGTNDLYVVSVHLLTANATTRAAEALQLKGLIQANFPANAWIIIGGDCNTDSRSEGAITTQFGTFLSDNPVPSDEVSTASAADKTNAGRNKPYDYVLPSFSLTNYLTPVVLPSHTFPKGLVFDSRVYTPLTDVSPVVIGDSGAVNMQHMAVIKDFLITVDSGSTTNPPAITAQPVSQTNGVGANVTFSVTATGTAPLAYQWRFFGTNLPGATVNSYSLTNIQSTNAGDYTVVITNIAGSITSSVATLTVTTSPTISTNPQSQTVTVGGNATFTVGAGGSAPLSYQWRFNNADIGGATLNSYTRSSAQLVDAGNYTVVVTNSTGSVTSSVAVLTVNEPTTGTLVTLAGWDVSGSINFGTSPLPPSTNAANLTIVGLTRGSGVLTPTGAAARGWGGTSWDSASAAAAVTAGDFATLSIAANAGYKVSFTSINKFDYRRSGTGPANGVLQYQVGAGTFTDITILSYPTSTSGGAALSAIDLSGIGALQNIAANTVVTFRIVNHSATGSGGTWYIFDVSNSTALDFSVQGVVNSITVSNPPASAPTLTNAALSGIQFQFLLTGTTGSNYIVQAITDLSLSNWISLRTNAAPFTFVESNVFTLPQRFYRGMVAP
ncbi:MAG: hypothetical protein D4R57_01235 [Verrucomicrobiales bacterium]|nr:MAG: hypothetical protein D4R57_01235 [Verrucomicrobiales bacterium]